MQTKKVIESLIFKSKNKTELINSLKLCRIINENERAWTAANNEELNSVIEEIIEPYIICCIGKVITVFVISSNKINRLYPCLIIKGEVSEFSHLSKSKISSMIIECMSFEDFLPENYCNQLIYIYKILDKNSKESSEKTENSVFKIIKSEVEKTVECIIFTEYRKNYWTIDNDITSLDRKSSNKTNLKTVVQSVLKDID